MNRLGKWLGPMVPFLAHHGCACLRRRPYGVVDQGLPLKKTRASGALLRTSKGTQGRTSSLSYWTQEDLPTKVMAALAADELPDVVYCVSCSGHRYVGLTMDYSLI